MQKQWKKPIEMVNSVCQLDQAMGWPDICSNIILDVSVGMFLHEFNI